jgi:hypothetical protein
VEKARSSDKRKGGGSDLFQPDKRRKARKEKPLKRRNEMFEAGVKDIKKFNEYLEVAHMNNWYAAPAIFLSQDYPIFYKILKGCLCLFLENGHLFVPPIGAKENAPGAINEVIQYQKEIGAEHVIEFWDESYTDRCWAFKSRFNFEPVDNNYINNIETVLSLKGKKLKVLRHNSRNEEANEGVYSKVYIPKFRDEVKSLFQLTKSTGEFNDNYNYKILDLIPYDDNIIAEVYFKLPSKRVIAINVGQRLTPTVMNYLINKSYPEYKYLVDITRYRFHAIAKSLGYTFMNDGSDLDREGLKRLKKKFAPSKIVTIYRAELREDKEE